MGSPPLLLPPSGPLGQPTPAASPPVSPPTPPTPQPPALPQPNPLPVNAPNALPPPYSPPFLTQAGQPPPEPPQDSTPGNASAGPVSPPWLLSVSPPPDVLNWDSPDLLVSSPSPYHFPPEGPARGPAPLPPPSGLQPPGVPLGPGPVTAVSPSPGLTLVQPVVAFQTLVSFTEGTAVESVAASLVRTISESVAPANVTISIAVASNSNATRRRLLNRAGVRWLYFSESSKYD